MDSRIEGSLFEINTIRDNYRTMLFHRTQINLSASTVCKYGALREKTCPFYKPFHYVRMRGGGEVDLSVQQFELIIWFPFWYKINKQI